ncbi:MAG TPA: DUF1616 domain-containing protein [Candidatus Bathyarchaeota archaeon]|nr:DUF1616 domain-containing protein [Candidatus Bathyarchaeota archaeon]
MPSRSQEALKKHVIRLIKMKKAETVSDIVELVSRRYGIKEDEVINAVKSLHEDGKISLEPPPVPASSMFEYLLRIESLWFPLALTIIAVTMLSIYLFPQESIFKPVRWVFGSIFVLFLPGYLTVEALFPDPRELDSIERLALSMGLSLAITPLIGLLLNYTPWGIRLNPTVLSLSAYSLLISMVAAYRKFKVNQARLLMEAGELGKSL